MHRIVCVIFILFMFMGCKKGKTEFVINGQITDSTFGGSLSGATVRLFEIEAGTQDEIQLGTIVTNATGDYSFTFSRDKAESYRIEVKKENYFDINHTISFSSLSTDQENVYNFSTTAKSWVNLHFVNNGGSTSDIFTFIKQAGKEGCTECCGTSPVTFNGVVDTSIICINDANTEYSYLWTLNNGSPFVESITTTPFDTVELLLNY